MYPFMINLQDKKIVVVGGGKIAAKRIRSLLPWLPQITVVSPVIEESLQLLVATQAIRYKERTFRSSDVEGSFLVIAATNDANINQIVKDSCNLNQLYNVVDDAESSTFHFPAIYERNGITVAVATNGISPSLASSLRDEFAAIIDELEPDYLLFLKEARHILKEAPFSTMKKQQLLKECLDDSYKKDTAQRSLFLEKVFAAIGQ